MDAKAVHVLHQQRHRQRKQAGLKPRATSWQWMTQASYLKLAREAYRAASWACRGPEVTPAAFVEELGRQLHLRVVAQALAAGLTDCPAPWPELAAELASPQAQVPPGWMPQYPQFEAPQVGDADQEQEVRQDLA